MNTYPSEAMISLNAIVITGKTSDSEQAGRSKDQVASCSSLARIEVLLAARGHSSKPCHLIGEQPAPVVGVVPETVPAVSPRQVHRFLYRSPYCLLVAPSSVLDNAYRSTRGAASKDKAGKVEHKLRLQVYAASSAAIQPRPQPAVPAGETAAAIAVAVLVWWGIQYRRRKWFSVGVGAGGSGRAEGCG